jgi:hypothetical protein
VETSYAFSLAFIVNIVTGRYSMGDVENCHTAKRSVVAITIYGHALFSRNRLDYLHKCQEYR